MKPTRAERAGEGWVVVPHPLKWEQNVTHVEHGTLPPKIKVADCAVLVDASPWWQKCGCSGDAAARQCILDAKRSTVSWNGRRIKWYVFACMVVSSPSFASNGGALCPEAVMLVTQAALAPAVGSIQNCLPLNHFVGEPRDTASETAMHVDVVESPGDDCSVCVSKLLAVVHAPPLQDPAQVDLFVLSVHVDVRHVHSPVLITVETAAANRPLNTAKLQ